MIATVERSLGTELGARGGPSLARAAVGFLGSTFLIAGLMVLVSALVG